MLCPFGVVINGRGKASVLFNDVLRNEGFNFSFSDFRHFHSGYAQRRSKATLAAYEAIETDEMGILDDSVGLLEQSNRTVASSIAYYACQESISGIATSCTEADDIDSFRKASNVAHLDMGLLNDANIHTAPINPNL